MSKKSNFYSRDKSDLTKKDKKVNKIKHTQLVQKKEVLPKVIRVKVEISYEIYSIRGGYDTDDESVEVVDETEIKIIPINENEILLNSDNSIALKCLEKYEAIKIPDNPFGDKNRRIVGAKFAEPVDLTKFKQMPKGYMLLEKIIAVVERLQKITNENSTANS